MRFLTIPAPVPLVDLFGTVLIEQTTGKPATMSLKNFLLGRLTDPKFIAGKKGLEGSIIVLEAKQRIDKFSDEAGAIGELEDEEWRRLKDAAVEPDSDYNQGEWPRIRHCVVPLIQAIVEAKTTPPASA